MSAQPVTVETDSGGENPPIRAGAFRELMLPPPNINTAAAHTIAAEFNRLVDGNDIVLECGKDAVTVRAKRADIKQLRALADDVASRHKLPSDNFLTAAVDAIAAIGGYATRQGKREFTGYNRERKVKNRADKEQRRGKRSVNRNTPAQPGRELPEQFRNQIICADSETFLRQLPDNCVDIVFTSPPYNFGLDYGNGGNRDAQKWRDYFQQLFRVFDECIRVVKHGGRIVVNVQPLYSDYVPSHHIISRHFLQRGMIWKGEILWEKNNYNCKYTSWGSWKSPSAPYLKYSWEFVEVFCKGAIKKPGLPENADINGDDFKKWVYGKWSIAPERGNKHGHPAMFPEELARRVLQLFSFRGDTVLDPFNGAGTTTLVARQTGRNFLGVDISPEYCQTAQQRLAGELL